MKSKVKFNYRLRDRNGIYHVVVYWINPITKEQESKSKKGWRNWRKFSSRSKRKN